MLIFETETNTEYNIELKRLSGEEQMVCPKCSHTRKKKTVKCFSWNNDKGVGHCGHCESSFATKSEKRAPEKQYALPTFNNRTQLSDNAVQYFFRRGISQKTLLDLKVTEGPEFMPQTGATENTIQFNYFRNDQLINTKFRDGRKNFKLVKDAEIIFYNLDSIANATEVVICEGEPDALSWHESGWLQVLSVPNGATKPKVNPDGSVVHPKLEYLDNCFEHFKNVKKIYLSTDNDEPGIALRDELARRLGYERCHKLDFGTCKDANEYLIKYGPEDLIDTLSEAKAYPIKGVFTIDDCEDDIDYIYEHGLPTGAKTGDRQFDEHLGCMPGELTMVTGIPGHGKSIYLDQISIGLCIHSDWKFGVCSPESHPMAFYFTRMIKRLTGKKFSKANLSLDELSDAKSWVRDRYSLIKPEEGYSLDSILESAKGLVLRKGIKGLILDPWNRIENTKPPGMQDGEWIVSCLVKIINFAQQTDVHVFLVAHPTKMSKNADGSNYLVPNLYSISGSAHFFNMTQNGFTVYRNMVTNTTEIHMQKVKWEHLGKTGILEYTYYDDNSRFYTIGEDPTLNWLTGQSQVTNDYAAAIQPSIEFNTYSGGESPF